MKDYTISHPCGLEQRFSTLKQARKEAALHKKNCKVRHEGLTGARVIIDEYDSEGGDMGGGELTGKYWRV